MKTGPNNTSQADTTNTESTPLFSIVMPVYGVEDHIGAAIESVLAQTLSSWELIIVDDASLDASGKIAREFAARDNRIKVAAHGTNRWVGEARNTGMNLARGRYLWFFDPDDLCLPELLEKCAAMLAKHPADAVLFGHVERYFNSEGRVTAERPVIPESAVLTRSEELRARILDYEKMTCYGYPWNKMYDLERIRRLKLRFGSTMFIEDILFNIAYFQDAESLDVIGEPLYLYAKKEGSNITNSFDPEYYQLHRRRIEALCEQQRAWGTLDEKARATLGSLLSRYVLSALERNCDTRSGMDRKARRRWCEETFADPLYQELVPYAQADNSRALKICLGPLKKGDVSGALRLGGLIHFVRGRASGLYRRLRSQR